MPENYNATDYPPFAVTVDLNVFTIRDGSLKILLVKRLNNPFKGSYALPGGFTDINESTYVSAKRELKEETNIEVDYLEQLKTYSEPHRDPRMRVVSVAYVALVADLPDPIAGDDAAESEWKDVKEIFDEDSEITLAFDHKEIITDAVNRIRNKLEYTTIACEFVSEKFTLADLWKVYNIVCGDKMPLPNFRRKVQSTKGFVIKTSETRKGRTGPPAALYIRGLGTDIHPPLLYS